jgi:hypothetical protein
VSPARNELDFISQKTALFIATTMKISNVIEHYSARLCSGEVMCFLIGKTRVFTSISEDCILHSHHRENC